MNFAQALLFSLYYAMLGLVAVMMGYRAALVPRYFRRAGRDPEPRERFDVPPLVTIQLPVYNEPFVIERLLDAVARISWPRDRLQIQILDDSTDETTAIAARKTAELVAAGLDVEHRHRTDRSGYKAGALAAGTATAKGEFLGVFDADFVPEPDFLHRTMDHFTDPGVGFVQTRWSYLNRDFGFLTQGMGLLLDGHFVLEQTTRSRGGYIFNFNGTGGVWRRRAIEAAGGWQDDTICEDTDLSYRAHFVGYRGVFLRDVPCPSELPVQVTAMKSQQHRWAKGLTECFLKLMPLLWRSRLPLRKKLDASFHLGANLGFPASLLMTVITLPLMFLRMQGMATSGLSTVIDTSVFALVVVTQLLYYAVATRELHANWWQRLRFLPFFPIVGVGLAVNNARGVVEALLGHRTEFVRTPKLGVERRAERVTLERARTYALAKDLPQPLVELAFGAYYVFMAFVQLQAGLVFSALVTLVLSAGLFTMGAAALLALRAQGRGAPVREPLTAGAGRTEG